MAGAEVTGTELFDQMSGETTDMTMRQGPDLFEETNFGGTPPVDEQPTIPAGGCQTFLQRNSQPLLKLQILILKTLEALNTSPLRILKKILVGSIATWVKSVRRAYNNNPSTKTRINIDDFVFDKDGLKLKVIDRDGSPRMVPLSNRGRGGYLVLKNVINRSIVATRQKLSEIFPGIDFAKIDLSKETREILTLKEKIPTLTPGASPEEISQAATAASTAVESLVGTAEAGVGVRQEDLGLNIGEFDLRTLQGFDLEMQRLKGELRIHLDQLA